YLFDAGPVARIYTKLSKFQCLYCIVHAALNSSNRCFYLKKHFLSDRTTEQVAEQLTCVNPHFKVFQGSQMPKRWHHAATARIGDLVLSANLHYTVNFQHSSTCLELGDHGYDFRFSAMHVINTIRFKVNYFIVFRRFSWESDQRSSANMPLWNRFRTSKYI